MPPTAEPPQALLDGIQARLKEGLTFSQVARDLGVTKSRVTGICWRRGWTSVGSRKVGTQAQRRARQRGYDAARRNGDVVASDPPKRSPAILTPIDERLWVVPAAPPLPVDADIPDHPHAVDLARLRDGQCRWPLWSLAERGGFYCGAPVVAPRLSYCPACSRFAFDKAGSRHDAELMKGIKP